jgi:hypothetical protein
MCDRIQVLLFDTQSFAPTSEEIVIQHSEQRPNTYYYDRQ